jgi:hypothetical protein
MNRTFSDLAARAGGVARGGIAGAPPLEIVDSEATCWVVSELPAAAASDSHAETALAQGWAGGSAPRAPLKHRIEEPEDQSVELTEQAHTLSRPHRGPNDEVHLTRRVDAWENKAGNAHADTSMGVSRRRKAKKIDPRGGGAARGEGFAALSLAVSRY